MLRIWPLFLPAIWLIPGLWSFPYPSSSAPFSDVTVSHFPNAVFLKQAILEHHTIPLWSPTILSGYPFAANPLSGLWYPPGWLALLFPLPFGFNFTVLLHMLWGGIGVYLLLKAEGLGHVAALFGGLAFESFSKYYAHYGAGHLTLLYAVPWTAWLLLAERKCSAASGQTTSKTWIRFLHPGVILGLIFLADPRWAAYAGIVWIIYGISLRHNLINILKRALVAALIAGPLAIPLWEYIRLSTRSNLNPEDVFAFSLPPARLLGLIFPDMGGYHEWILYPGSMVLIFSLLTILWKKFEGAQGFWIGLGIGAVLFSLGSNIPLLDALGELPGLGLLRVPTRALFVLGLSMAALSAYGLDYILAGVSIQDRRRASLLMTGLVGFVLTIVIGILVLTGGLASNFVWGSLALLVGSAWTMVQLKKWLPPQAWVSGLIALSLLDFSVVNLSLFSPRDTNLVLEERQGVIDYLKNQSGEYRVYSPSYSLPQHVAALHGMELADGVDPMHLSAYADFMEAASGVPRQGYSVTIPAFDNGDPDTANIGYEPAPEHLGLLNAKYVLSEFEIPVDGLKLVEQIGRTHIYQNMVVLPRAWVERHDRRDETQFAPARITSRAPSRIVLQASGPGELVLSEIAYPGWRVIVDGQTTESQQAYRLLRSVSLEAGNHKVVFVFRPLSVYLGLAGLLVGIVLAFLDVRKQ
ncbi:MAG TPA: hypothetical protein VFZ76_14945 [Anaerolineales bacterium]